MKKIITVLGSTGSIGTQTLTTASNLGLKIKALSADKNIGLLYTQIKEYLPEYCVVTDYDAYLEFLTYDLPDTKVLYGQDGLSEICKMECDMVINALVGFAGLRSTLDCIDSGNDIGLANKESMVTFGSYIMKRAKEKNIMLIPVDSEHSAIFQCLIGESSTAVKNIILTASGGAFRDYKKDELVNVTVKSALSHPNWKMGKKITIDSATMMNKGLEVIEARYLFDIKKENIKVIIQRESIIHSMVEFADGSYFAQLGSPDMRIPITYALTYPERVDTKVPSLDFEKLKTLNFEAVDFEKYPCLELAYDALSYRNSMSIVMNAANEECVDAFLNGKIRFLDISRYIEKMMSKHKDIEITDYMDVLSLHTETKEKIIELIGGK